VVAVVTEAQEVAVAAVTAVAVEDASNKSSNSTIA
jgi:hypothetical protein